VPARISAERRDLRPMIIIQRKMHELELFESGFALDKVLIIHREGDFID
jgi:hypothetical protein